MTNLKKMINAKTEEDCFNILLDYRIALDEQGDDFMTIEWLYEEANK